MAGLLGPQVPSFGKKQEQEFPQTTVVPFYPSVTNGDLQNIMDISQPSPQHPLYSTLWST